MSDKRRRALEHCVYSLPCRYSKGGIELVGFNTQIVDHGMGLQAKDQFPGRTAVDPQPSPAMAGGLFSISRDFFFEIGAFDEHMEFWGGENIEISFRIWQCGGTLELLPCARIGHVFGGMRNPNKCGWSSHRNVGAVNKWRAIEVWMGPKHKEIMKEFLPRPSDDMIGDLSNMIKIRDGLQCKSFDWFLTEVYPECWMNMMEHALYKGNLMSEKYRASNLCVHQPGGRGALKGLADCKSLHVMRMSAKGELIMRDIDTCLEARGGKELASYACHGMGGNQHWAYNEATKELTAPVFAKQGQNVCLTAVSPNSVVIATCDGSASQQWTWVEA